MSLCNLSHRHFPRKHKLFAHCARHEGDPSFVRLVQAEIEVTVNGLELKFSSGNKTKKNTRSKTWKSLLCNVMPGRRSPSSVPLHFSRRCLSLCCYCIFKWTKKKIKRRKKKVEEITNKRNWYRCGRKTGSSLRTREWIEECQCSWSGSCCSCDSAARCNGEKSFNWKHLNAFSSPFSPLFILACWDSSEWEAWKCNRINVSHL